MKNKFESVSFRDPSGFIFSENDRLLRQVNLIYKDSYDTLMKSGLYRELVKKGWLVSHKEVKVAPPAPSAYKIIEPETIPLISYPYEWCFSQLKDAALLTLQIQKTALEHEMSLKDASSFNIQFSNGKPIFIDTLSFDKYEEGKPWIAYKQFCENFLAPLALMAHTDIRLGKLLQDNLGAIPLDLASNILPFKTRLNMGLLFHISLHARSQKRYEDVSLKKERNIRALPKQALKNIILSLEGSVKALNLPKKKTVWTNYYQFNHPSYNNKTFKKKKSLVEDFLKKAKAKTVWDWGANTGEFTEVASKLGLFTVSLDNDHTVVEQIYAKVKKDKINNVLPLWVDVINPTPSVGWENQERDSILQRTNHDTMMALALMHHLCITNNVPFTNLAHFFAQNCKNLIIEFVPKADPQVQVLLQSREDIFPTYDEQNFEKAFSEFFTIKSKEIVSSTNRTLYLMTTKEG